MNSAAPLEIIWSAMSIMALLGHLYALIDGVIDLAALYKAGRNGILRATATAQVGLSTVLSMSQLMFLIPGIIAMVNVSPTPSGTLSPNGTVTIICLLIGEFLMLSASAGTIWGKKYIRGVVDIYEDYDDDIADEGGKRYGTE